MAYVVFRPSQSDRDDQKNLPRMLNRLSRPVNPAAIAATRPSWAAYPVCNVYNDEELPVFQFRTDEWDLSQLVIPHDTVVIPSGWQRK